MLNKLRLLSVFAHPDDESLGMGGTLARYAAEGVETSLLVATRGERGWHGPPEANPGPGALGRLREHELRQAARTLQITNLRLLDYVDGTLAAVDPRPITAAIAGYIGEVRPQVVVTFGPDGATGHPDHIAIAQYTTAAIVRAATADHQVAKLYYLADSIPRVADFEAVLGPLAMPVDGEERRFGGWPAWAITTRIDVREYWRQAWQAVSCHRSQLPDYEQLTQLSDERQRELWGCQELYRAFSLVGGRQACEDDLFAGLRRPATERSAR